MTKADISASANEIHVFATVIHTIFTSDLWKSDERAEVKAFLKGLEARYRRLAAKEAAEIRARRKKGR